MRLHPKIVTAFTHASDEYMLPPQFVVGELEVRHVTTLDYDQNLVGGVGVDETTVTPIPNPTPELIRVLKEKSSEWVRHDRLLAEQRERADDGFREEHEDKEFEVNLVRKDCQEAFSAFCDEISQEDQRLTAERQAVVADLVKKHQRKTR